MVFNLKLEQCRMYYDMGFSLIPLRKNGKVPITKLLPKKSNGKRGWKPLRKRRASWPEIKDWLNKKPDINIGIITGMASNLVVIDIDHAEDKHGNKRIKISDDISTPTVETGRGKHLYFKIDKPVDSMKLPLKEFLIGEILAEGSYIVAPPSIHKSGREYRWEEKNSLARTKLMDFEDLKFKEEKCTSIGKKRLLITKNRLKGKRKSSKKHKGFDKKKSRKADKSIRKDSSKTFSSTWWKELSRDLDVARKILKLTGMDTEDIELGKAFKCPFHEDEKPSAALYMMEESELNKKLATAIYFADFHLLGRPEGYDPEVDGDIYLETNKKQQWFNLGELYFAVATGKELQRLKKGVGVVWWLRALDYIGECKPLPTIQARKLPEADPKGNYLYQKKSDDGKRENYVVKKESVEKVYEGFKYLLQLRTFYCEKQIGTPFSYRFATDWCGVSINTIRKAMKFLMQKGFIKVHEETPEGRANILDLGRKK